MALTFDPCKPLKTGDGGRGSKLTHSETTGSSQNCSTRSFGCILLYIFMSDKMVTQGEAPVTPSWRVPWDFAVNALVGTSLFAIIAIPAVGLDLAVRTLEPYGINNVTIFGLRAGEYALLGTDLWLFGVFLWRTATRAMQHL
jgi:hypothetical protein